MLFHLRKTDRRDDFPVIHAFRRVEIAEEKIVPAPPEPTGHDHRDDVILRWIPAVCPMPLLGDGQHVHKDEPFHAAPHKSGRPWTPAQPFRLPG